MTDEQLRILRHMLGIDDRRQRDPAPYRDYYCANPGNPALHELARLGMVQLYASRDGYEWFCTTPEGRAAALRSQRAIRYPRPRRIYLQFLSVSDAVPDLTFREFLTSPEFDEIRRRA